MAEKVFFDLGKTDLKYSLRPKKMSHISLNKNVSGVLSAFYVYMELCCIFFETEKVF